MSTIQLRPYQQEAVEAVFAAWRDGLHRPGLGMATGSGKTISFAEVIRRSGERSLVIAHRKELIEQAAQKIGFLGIDRDDIGVVMATRNEADRPVVVASIQTIANPQRLRQLGRFGLVVYDEVHHSVSPTAIQTLRSLGVGAGLPTKALGVTATWDRSDGIGLGAIWEQVVYEVHIESLIASGHLCDIRALTIETHLDTATIGTHHGEYDMAEVEKRIVDSDYADTLAHAVREYAADRTSLVFAPNVATAYVYRDALRHEGLTSEVVSGKTPRDEREATLRRFQEGRLRSIVNCGVYTEGTDIPRVDCIVMGRPTQSRALYQQMAGRGLRTFPGKGDCLILDLVGITADHKLQKAASLIGRSLRNGTREVRSFRDWIAGEVSHDEPGTTMVTVRGELGQTFRQSAKPVDLIDRKRLAWTQVELNAFSLPAGEQGAVSIVGQPDGTYRVIQFGRDRSRNEIASGLDIGYAQGVAEQFVMEAEAKQLANPSARWRGQPATEKQRETLDKMRLTYDPETITKGEASALITQAIERSNLRRMRKEDADVRAVS
jgi:superfamily II DNA or RNA helicase